MLCFVDGWLLYRSSRVVTESGSLESTAIMKYSYFFFFFFFSGNQHF